VQEQLGEVENFFCILKYPLYLCHHKSNILSLKGCLVFIKKGGEIRLFETLATNPVFRRTVPKPNPGKPGDDKNLTREP
jgi:hypothetical protein